METPHTPSNASRKLHSPLLKQALSAAQKSAQLANHYAVEPMHLVVSLLSLPIMHRSQLEHIFENCKIDRKTLLGHVQKKFKPLVNSQPAVTASIPFTLELEQLLSHASRLTINEPCTCTCHLMLAVISIPHGAMSKLIAEITDIESLRHEILGVLEKDQPAAHAVA